MTPDEAFAVYASMSGPRSLTKLRQQLTDEGLEAPSLSWLKKWSSRNEWVSRAREHDRLVAARASEISVESEAQDRVSAATKFDQAAIAAVDLVIAGLEKLEVSSPEDADRIMKIACAASAEAREIEKGKNPASAISDMAEELEKSEGGQGQMWAAQLREITSDAPVN
jgi:hypothetical protein